MFIYQKKDIQKKNLFEKMASEESLKEFIEKYNIYHELDIRDYKQELMEKLVKTYPNPDKHGDEEHWQLILIGLAISYIQRRYTLVTPSFDQLKVAKEDFDQYMTESTKTKTEQTIASYLVSIVCEEYEAIINHNDLSSLQIHILNLICLNTIRWINEIGKTVDGQYQLFNTISFDETSKVAGFKVLPIDKRLERMAECKVPFLFL